MRSPKTCTLCGGKQWIIFDGGCNFIRCTRCRGSGCNENESVHPDFPETLPPARLITGTCISGELTI